MSEATYAAIEDAIRAHVTDELDDAIATDWYVVIAAEQSAEHATSYLHVGSGSPMHTVYGLLSVAQQRILQEDDEEEED